MTFKRKAIGDADVDVEEKDKDENSTDDTSCSWWSTLQHEIVTGAGKGTNGFLSPKFRFSGRTRELYATQDIHIPNGNKVSRKTEIIDNESHKEDITTADSACIMKIPKEVMITKDVALALIPIEIQHALDVIYDDSNNVSTPLFSSKEDVQIAMGLAFVTSKSARACTDCQEERIAKAYLATLPTESSYWDSLPRRWSDKMIHERLKGSPLLHRTLQMKRGIQHDFDRILQEVNKKNIMTEFSISFGTFSDMLAAVTSRAFVIENCSDSPDFKYNSTHASSSSNIALIPILDLCNHCRGGYVFDSNQGSLKKKKNLSYAFKDGVMTVRAVTSIAKGEVFRLTYGAQGNGQLLLNYGFTIPNNLEPDGSSNDILEWVDHEGNTCDRKIADEPSLFLRTGPKLYSYGCFVKILEHLTQGNSSGKEIIEEDNDRTSTFEENPMDAFLNGEHEDFEDELDNEMDIYSGNYEGKEENDDDKIEQDQIDDELRSISKFCESVEQKLGCYTKTNDHNPLMTHGPEFFSLLLIQSEKRTLQFFHLAACKIRAILQKVPIPEASSNNFFATGDQSMVESQTNELAKTYMEIRHGLND